MSATRQTFFHILTDEFKRNADLKARCLSFQIKELAKRGDCRLFDSFPCIINQDELAQLVAKMQTIVLRITTLQDTDQGLFISETKDSDALWALQSEIAQKGCKQLLNVFGAIKKEVLQLLGWSAIATEINVQGVIAAYMARVNQEIYLQLTPLFKENNEASFACMRFINKNYYQCACDAVQADANFNTGVGIGVGVGVLTALSIFTGIMIAKKSATIKRDEVHPNWLNP